MQNNFVSKNEEVRLVDSLGVQKLYAVMGLSMGGIQSFEWATVFPDSTDRVIPVVGLAEADGYLIENLDVWGAPIKMDPKWNQGDYYGKAEPLNGLITGYKILLHQCQHYGGVSKTAGRKWAQEGKESWEKEFKAEEDLDNLAKSVAIVSDANSPAKYPALPERIEAVLQLREYGHEVIRSPRGTARLTRRSQCHRIIIT
jgi:homoserine O-acetyltransferase